MKRTFWLQVFIVVAVAGAFWIFWTRAPESAIARQGAPRAGFTAPAFSLTSLQGEQLSLQELRGSPVLVNFWATWCTPCRSEMPAIQHVAEAYAGDGLVVLLVNQGETEEQVRAFLQDLGITPKVLLDSDKQVGEAYHVHALPTTFFIDQAGKIQEMTIGGPMTEAYLRSRLDLLVGEVRP